MDSTSHPTTSTSLLASELKQIDLKTHSTNSSQMMATLLQLEIDAEPELARLMEGKEMILKKVCGDNTTVKGSEDESITLLFVTHSVSCYFDGFL